MKIRELHVDDFGAWHNLTLKQLGSGATVFYGPNEAGKTTLLNFVRTVLYGFSQQRCDRYLPPSTGHRAGGHLAVTDTSGKYELQRSAPVSYAGGEGLLTINSPNGVKHANELLTTLLAGVDEAIFNNVFAVGQAQMQQLATLSDTEAAKQLYGLATGVDRVSLYDVAKSLEDQRAILLPPTEAEAGSQGPGIVGRLLQKKVQLKKELKALRRDEGHLANVRQEHRQLEQQIKKKEAAKQQLDAKGSWPERSDKLRRCWNRCLRLNERLTRIGAIVDLPKDVASRVSQISGQVKQRRQEWEHLRDQRRQIKQQASSLKGCDSLYRHAAEIEALDRQRPRIVALERDVRQSKATLDELEFELQSELEELGLQTGTSSKQFFQLSDQVIEALRVPAREVREKRESAEALKQLAADRRKQAEVIKGQLKTAAVRFGSQDITKLVRQSVSLVERLQRRIDLDQQCEGLVRQLDEMEEESSYWQQRSMLPWSGVLVMCGVFSAGAMLLAMGALNGWFALQANTRLPMMLIGGSLAVVSLVIKGAFENSANQRAEACRFQVDALLDQQQSARDEAEELDHSMPAGGGSLDQRLMDAQKKVSELDQVIPLSQQLEELTREAEVAEHQTTLAIRELKDARRVWKASLRTVGLPDSLTPSQIGQIAGRVGDVTRLRTAVDDARRDLQERKQELDTIVARVDQLLLAGEIHDQLDGLDQQLTRLCKALEAHSESGREREELRGRWEELRGKQRRISAVAQSLVRSRRQLLEQHGLTGSRDYRTTLLRNKKAAKMRAERDRQLARIAEMLVDDVSIAKLRKMLDERSKALKKKLDQLDREWQSMGDDLKTCYERSALLEQKLQNQLRDNRREKKELEIQVVDERLRLTAHRWRVNALTTSILERIKQDYETKRQPVALAEASRYLERLTENRYVRIWTPLGRNSLSIDDHEGRALPVEKLSRGTRELVFLSLRLALVSSYGRRGAGMPIILDDVFVNFDEQRARATVGMLCDIAQAGQQMLVFTCHERIRDIFAELGADVRDLPVRVVGGASELTSAPAPNRQPKDAVTVGVQAEMDESSATDATKIARRRIRPFEPTWRDQWLELLPDLPSDDEEI